MNSRFFKKIGAIAFAMLLFLCGSLAWAQTPTPVAKLLANDGTNYDCFGISTALYGDTALIGAWKGDSEVWHSGSVYVFTRDVSGTWTQQAELVAADGTTDDDFGSSVSLDGDTALIGAWYDDDNGDSSGSAYVFTRDVSGTWTQQAKLVAADGAPWDNFGESVALDGNTALIGAYRDDDKGSDSGRHMCLPAMLAATGRSRPNSWPPMGPTISFGGSTALYGDTALIGAWNDDDKGIHAGSAYVFTRDASGTGRNRPNSWPPMGKMMFSAAR